MANPWPKFHNHSLKHSGTQAWIRTSLDVEWGRIYLKAHRVEDIHCILTTHPTQGLVRRRGNEYWIAYSGSKPTAHVIPAPMNTHGLKTARGPYYTIFIALFHQGLFKLDTAKGDSELTYLQRVITGDDL